MSHRSQFSAKLQCRHCNTSVSSAIWPLNGDAEPFYYEDSPGEYSLTLQCQSCGKDTFVVWDYDPGPMEKLDSAGATAIGKRASAANPKLCMVVKYMVQQAIAQGVVDYDELVGQAETSSPGQYDMEEVRPLLRRIWIELHQRS